MRIFRKEHRKETRGNREVEGRRIGEEADVFIRTKIAARQTAMICRLPTHFIYTLCDILDVDIPPVHFQRRGLVAPPFR